MTLAENLPPPRRLAVVKRTDARPAAKPVLPPASPPPSTPPSMAPPRHDAHEPKVYSTAQPLVTHAKAFSTAPGPGNPWPLFVASFSNVIRSRKAIGLLMLLLIPLYITWIIHGAVGMDDYEYNDYWGGAPLDATGGILWFQDASFGILFPFLVPVVIAAFAASAIGEEVEGKTLPYLFTRPVYRNWILLAKCLGTYLAVFLLAALGLVIFWFGSVSLTENPFANIGQLFGHIWVLALAILASGSTFLLLGVLWRRAIILIVVYLFLWEFILSQVPAIFFKRFSLVNYQRPILLQITGRTESIEDISLGFVGAGAAHLILFLIAAVGLAGALYVVSNKDYNV